MIQKYNIAIITGQLVVGGAERELYVWLSHLDRQKFEPVVLTLHPGHDDYWEKPIESLNIPLLRVPRRRNKIARLLDITQALRPYKPQLIHGWTLPISPYAAASAKMLDAKSLGFLQLSYQTFCNRPMESYLSLFFTDAIVANSQSAGEQLRARWKYKRRNIFVVQNAVEELLVDRSAMREKLSNHFGISSANIWIGSMGRMEPRKHFDHILETLALLREDINNFHFILIGDGQERTNLESLTKTLGISRHVTFAGEVPDARDWLSALDIFCFTSLEEGLPNVVMEAAVAGVPVVSWRLPFIEELLIDGDTALFVDPENLVCFRDALLSLIRSPESRKRIGNAARNHILGNFSLERMLQQMTCVYEELLGVQ